MNKFYFVGETDGYDYNNIHCAFLDKKSAQDYIKELEKEKTDDDDWLYYYVSQSCNIFENYEDFLLWKASDEYHE